MTTEKALLTAEELLQLPDDGHLYELLDGVMVEMTPPGGTHGEVSNGIAYALTAHVRAHALGTVLINDPGIILRRNPDRVRAPDVCFIGRDRIPPEGIPVGYLELVPDFVVEVISPGDRAAEVQAKIDEWLEAGARLVWAVYPSRRSIIAFTPDGAARVYAARDTITGVPVLPELTLRVADLFP